MMLHVEYFTLWGYSLSFNSCWHNYWSNCDKMWIWLIFPQWCRDVFLSFDRYKEQDFLFWNVIESAQDCTEFHNKVCHFHFTVFWRAISIVFHNEIRNWGCSWATYVVTILFLKAKTLHRPSFGLLCHLVQCDGLQTAFCYSMTCGVFPLRLSKLKKSNGI